MTISPVSISLMKSQALSSLIDSTSGARNDDSWSEIFSLLNSNSTQLDPLSSDPLSILTQSGYTSQNGSIKGLSPAGRNTALFDPESAYKMMSVINSKDVYYKAQFSELDQMKSSVSQMQDAGLSLSNIALTTGNENIKSQVQDFVGQYNAYIQRFDADVQQGGLLSDTQAALASRFELEQNINNRFFGARDGIHGLGDLGIRIDPSTRLASLDTTRLDALLASNKAGVANTLQEFSANFAKSASMLNSNGNFILKQLDNLNRAIKYIADNKAALQAEFGTGDAAKPTGQIAQALAAYNKTYGA